MVRNVGSTPTSSAIHLYRSVGYRQILILPVNLPINRNTPGNYVELDISKPFYKSLNGQQTREDIRYGFKFDLRI